METDSELRKRTPIWSGVMQYFPNAIEAVARVSWKGNEKHNPGEPLHWARGKSMDQEDCIARHMINPYEPDEDGELHIVHVAWRALAAAELALERVERALQVPMHEERPPKAVQLPSGRWTLDGRHVSLSFCEDDYNEDPTAAGPK